MYYFNICADANDVPESCQELEKAVQAPVYQVSNQSDCFWLGQLRSMEWELIDENEPAAVRLSFANPSCRGAVRCSTFSASFPRAGCLPRVEAFEQNAIEVQRARSCYV